MTVLRSIVAVTVGLLLISVIVEPIEFALVALVHGGATTDQEVYFSVRNRPPVLAAKLVYNTLAGAAGGFLAGRLAGRAPLGHGIALAVLQTVAFGWALVNPELRRTMPDPMWASVIVLTAVGIIMGALLQSRTRAARALRR